MNTNILGWTIKYDDNLRLLKNENEFILLNELNSTILIGEIIDTIIKISDVAYDAEIEINDKLLTIKLKENILTPVVTNDYIEFSNTDFSK